MSSGMSPETAKLGFIGRCLLVTACAAALILLWRVLQPMAPADPASRLVTARGDLAGDEKATGLVTDLCRSPERFMLATGDRRDDEA